jgi:3'(2'), 5'-bisphosphate nucleotidase
MTWSEEISAAKKLAMIAGEEAMTFYGKVDAVLKENGTPVTAADMRANYLIVGALAERFPEHAIISEEGGNREGTSGYAFHVDPIDGTKGFLNKMDQFSVQIGMTDPEGEIVMGVVYKPATGEMYFGEKGNGSFRVDRFLNCEQILPISRKGHSEGLWAVARNGYDDEDGRRMKYLRETLGVEKVLRTSGEGLRMLKVADGIADVQLADYRDMPSNSWDYVAPVAILKNGGFYVGTVGEGKSARYVAALNESVFDKVYSKIEASAELKGLFLPP